MSYSNRYIREQSIKDAVYRAELDKCDADEKELRATRDLLTASSADRYMMRSGVAWKH